MSGARHTSMILGFYIPDEEDLQSDMQKLMIRTWGSRTKGPAKGQCRICSKLLPSSDQIQILPGVKIWPTNCDGCQILVDAHLKEEEEKDDVADDNTWDKECPQLFQEISTAPRLVTDINWDQYHKVRAWKPGRIGMYITGDSGKGKTAAVWALFRELLMQHKTTPILVTSTDLARSLSVAAKDLDSSYPSQLSSVSILIIDDFGKEKYTQAITTQIFEIINRRYERQLPVIITTRYGGAALQQRFAVSQDSNMGNDICRRIAEMIEKVEF